MDDLREELPSPIVRSIVATKRVDMLRHYELTFTGELREAKYQFSLPVDKRNRVAEERLTNRICKSANRIKAQMYG